MKKTIFLTQALLSVTLASSAGNIILEGNYQGKNLYVQNPLPDAELVSAFKRLK